jgi:hypothetical protein
VNNDDLYLEILPELAFHGFFSSKLIFIPLSDSLLLMLRLYGGQQRSPLIDARLVLGRHSGNSGGKTESRFVRGVFCWEIGCRAAARLTIEWRITLLGESIHLV